MPKVELGKVTDNFYAKAFRNMLSIVLKNLKQMWYAMAFVAYQQAHLQNAKCLPAVLGETETVNSQTHISSMG